MTFADIVSNLLPAFQMLVYVIISLALVVFIYGLVRYVANAGDEEQRKESLSYITAGVIGLFVMIAVWGLVYMIANTFDVSVGLPQLR